MIAAIAIAVCIVGICLCAAGLYILDTAQKARLERDTKRGALRLAALREFEKDHPDRERIGLKGER